MGRFRLSNRMTELNEIEIEKIEADMPKFNDLLKTIKETTLDLIEKTDDLTGYMSKYKSKKGMPLLSTKNECMGHYLTDLISLAQSQLNGKKVEDSDLINRLIEQRVTMERIRPLEDKMKYRIDKLTALAQGNVKTNDPINLRPDVDNLESSTDEDSSEDESEDKKVEKKKDGIYRLDKTKMRPMLPPDSVQSAEDRALQKAKKRAIGSAVVRELALEAGDEPEQYQTNELHDKMSKRRLDQARIRESEEANFIRVQRKKGDRHQERGAMRNSGFNGLTSFADTSVLHGAMDGADVLDKMKKLKRERKVAMAKKKH